MHLREGDAQKKRCLAWETPRAPKPFSLEVHTFLNLLGPMNQERGVYLCALKSDGAGALMSECFAQIGRKF